MSNKRVRNLVLIAALLLLAAFLFFLLPGTGDAGKEFEVLVGGELYGRYPLSEDRIIQVGHFCVLTVRDGTVSVSSADCPTQMCVRHSAISKKGEMIVCLPNHVIICIPGEGDMDAVI